MGPLGRTDGSKFARLHDYLGMRLCMSQSQSPVAMLELDLLHQQGDDPLSPNTTVCHFGPQLRYLQYMSCPRDTQRQLTGIVWHHQRCLSCFQNIAERLKGPIAC